MRSPIVSELNQTMRDAECWKNAVLYQPNEELQILLPENASCLAVKAFLHMSKLAYTVKTRPNAEFMSPGGHITKLPFLHVGSFVVAELEPIVRFAEGVGEPLVAHLDEDQRHNLRAYMSVAEQIYSYAEIYMSWAVEEVREGVTKPRNGSVFPFPINRLQNWRKQRHFESKLAIFKWENLSLDDVLEKVKRICMTLTELLQDKDFFFGSTPTELDALVFGHLFVITTTSLPNNGLAATIKNFPSLLRLCARIEKLYFSKK